ncbi:MAG: glycosyltransferase family 2 protein [Gemmatimonadota bacterium]
MTAADKAARATGPDISLIMPCYNEEENLGYTIPRLISAFSKEGYRLQLVAVNNGSRDRTSDVIAELASRYPEVTPAKVEKNIGFGQGILAGIPHCTATWVGMVAADGQVDAEDVVRLFDACAATDGQVLGKVRRRFRMDGPMRKVISIGYNTFVWMLFPNLGSLDVNGNPRLMRRDVLIKMDLQSTNWLLDPEMLIKAHYMGVRVLELNVFARMRGNGLSHVRLTTCWEFFKHLLAFRFSSKLNAWRRGLTTGAPVGGGSAVHVT